jgi:hypothetical protein
MDLVDWSRQLFTQVDILSTAIQQKNTWAFGDAWEPHFTGEMPTAKERAWVQEAIEFITQQFFPDGNVRGQQFDFRTSMKLMGYAWDIDGDDLMILTEGENHFPQYAMFPATQVGSWSDDGVRFREKTTVSGSNRLDGAELVDGIIRDPATKRYMGVRLLVGDGKYKDIPARHAHLEFEPQWTDQVRGIPKPAPSLTRLVNLLETDERLHDSIKLASGLTFKFKNAEGEAPVGNEAITAEDSPTAAGDATVVGGNSGRSLHYHEQTTSGGEIRYLDSTQNEEIEPINYSSPHQNVESFIARIQHGVLWQVGWPYELIKVGETGRAPTRLVADLANKLIWDRQATGLRRWKKMISYALAKGAEHGFLRSPPSPKMFVLWEPGLPAQISVDKGNDAKEDREALKMGITTKSIINAKNGYHEDVIANQRKKELVRAINDAKELHALVKGEGVSFQQCMEWVEQRSPNPVTQMQQQSQQTLQE